MRLVPPGIVVFVCCVLAACGAGPSGDELSAKLLGRWRVESLVEQKSPGSPVLTEHEPPPTAREMSWEFVSPLTLVRCGPGAVFVGPYRVDGGILSYDLRSVGRPHVEAYAGVVLNPPGGRRFTTLKDGFGTRFERDDPDLSGLHAELVGVWRSRATEASGETGLIFTPGGCEVELGRTSSWPVRAAALGTAANYRLTGEGTLEEELFLPETGRRRRRAVQLDGDVLVIRQPGMPDRSYERAREPLTVR